MPRETAETDPKGAAEPRSTREKSGTESSLAKVEIHTHILERKKLYKTAVKVFCIWFALFAAAKYLKNTRGKTGLPLTFPVIAMSGLGSPLLPSYFALETEYVFIILREKARPD